LSGVGEEVQDGDQEYRDRLGEIKQQLGFRVGEDLGWFPQVALDDARLSGCVSGAARWLAAWLGLGCMCAGVVWLAV
jgi:hypothetical protein